MKYITLPAVCLMCACSLLSCERAAGRLLVLEGFFLNSSHRHNEAIVSYNKALTDEEAAPYAEAGLAAVYAALDENKAALERLEDSQKLLAALPSSEHRELRYRNSYNKGVAFFADGDFPAAARAFREALRVDASRLEAKRNLELSLLSTAAGKAGQGETEETPEEIQSRKALFEYFRQKEQTQWKSREWAAEEESAGQDY